MRILNSQFDSRFTNLSFLANCTNLKRVSRTTCAQLTFSVIGSDSALFNEAVHNIQSVSIASAERLEILIVFDGKIGNRVENPIRQGSGEKVFLVSDN